jgi:polyphosphate kinase 2 (PPK2 family)
VARVHPEVLAREKLPASLVGKHIWDERLEDIAAFERYLARQGIVVLKFFLHLSKEEQRRRFLARIDEPEKNWKFSAADVAERARWKDYRQAYEEAIRATAAPHAPWYVVPADHKWFTRLVVSESIAAAMESLDLHYPELPPEERERLLEARSRLLTEG